MRSLLLAVPLLLVACGHDDANRAPIADNGVRQTHFAGMVTAGGRTSGEAMAAAGSPATPQPGPAGTPGIPKGAEGNTGGTAMGGTTPSAPSPGAAASAALTPASAASTPAMSDAQRQAQELSEVQDMVAVRWKARAASQGWTIHPAVALADSASASAAAAPASAAASATAGTPPIKSEKFGTAPASPDVKTATRPVTPAVLDRKAPDAAGPH